MKRRVLSLLLCMALVVPAIVNYITVDAAEDAVVYEEYTNVSEEYRGADKKAPSKDNYVFAGWYKGQNENEPMTEAEADNASTAYAKFVDKNVLSIKYQLSADVDANSTETDLRVLTTVDSLEYSSVGFKIQIGNKSTMKTSKVVYETITGYVDGKGVSYVPTVFASVSKYFMAYEVTGVTSDYFDTEFVITPVWTTLDGTEVSGVGKDLTLSAVIEDITTDNVNVAEDGTITLQNDYSGKDHVVYVCKESVKAGDVISFNVDVNPRQDLTVWVFGCDYEKDGWTNEWKAQTIFNEYLEWPSDGSAASVSLTAQGNAEAFSIYVKYRDASNAKTNVVTISNLTVEKDIVEVAEDGTITMQNALSGSDHVVYVCKESVKAGDVISFNVDVNPRQDLTVWVFGCDYEKDGWTNEWKAQTIFSEYAEWPSDGSAASVSLTAQGNAEAFSIYVKYRDASNAKTNVVTISNLTVAKDIVEVAEDGTITMQSVLSGNNKPYYVCDKSVKAGDVISFNLDISPRQHIALFIFGCDYSVEGWTKQWHAQTFNPEWNEWPSDGSPAQVTYTVPSNADAFTIMIEYRDAEQNFYENVVTISNLTVAKDIVDVAEDGTITMQNVLSGSDQAVYVCQQSVNAGDVISFNVDVTPRQDLTIWVFGCDYKQQGWTNEWHAQTIWNEYAEWPSDGGPATVTLGAGGNSGVFSIVVRYRDASNAKENVVTITNFQVNGVAVN